MLECAERFAGLFAFRFGQDSRFTKSLSHKAMASALHRKKHMTSIYWCMTIVAAWWVPEAYAQTFFTNTGAYLPSAQQSAVLNFYMHDNLDTSPSSAVTVVPSVGSLNGGSNNEFFGAIAVFDDALTLTADPTSQMLGRGRGFYVFNSMDAGSASLEFVWTAVFGASSGYSGSTLSFKGYDKINDTDREIVITGGTGQFRMARGWATITTAASNGGAANLFFTVHVYYGV